MTRRNRWPILLAGMAALLLLAVGAPTAGAHPCFGAGDDDADHECVLAEEEEAGETEYFELGEPVGQAVNGDSLGGPFEWSPNLTPLGFTARYVTTGSLFNSDLAFWGDLAFQGHYAGFRILDVSNPADPVQLINYTACGTAGQGDVVVWENLLIRSWDAPQNSLCGGVQTGTGFEGISIFDVSNPSSPQFVRHLRMASTGNAPGAPAGCGSHTATAVPDPDRGNLYLYIGGSSGSCTGMDIVRINMANPTDAVYLRRAAAGRQCHDNNVIMGDVNLAMCAGGNGFSVFRFDPSIDPAAPGGLENPTLLYSRPVSGVSIAHSGSFTFDGKVLVFGHEPGGGSQAQCQASSSVTNRSIFFFDPLTGTQLGTYLHPRPQTAQENCTWHNFNVVPTYTGYVFVSGNYQSGIQVVDFTNPAAARTIAYADPARLGTGSGITLGGDWSTYWYDGYIYESDIRRGLITWSLDDVLVNRALRFGFSNPQTQMSSFELDLDAPDIAIASPLDEGQYLLGSEVLADFECTDANSGVESCVGPVANGAAVDTSTVGLHTFTVEATDVAGNVAAKTVTYNVHWPFTGFTPPFGKRNEANAGASFPVKFDLGDDRGLAVLAEGYPKSKLCGADDSTLESTVSSEPFSFSGVHYTYAWKTDKAWSGQCRELQVKLVDNTVHTATFQFK